MTKFSAQLVQRMQKHFADKYGASLTEELAEEYLDSWADLYLLVVGGGRAMPDLPPEGKPASRPP
ncbi:MAG: hypothetical protein P4L74_06895 [Candidatus Doudnabacteria bacterium]|nr:hypothetical protein [Candidatus Doudnabacteria bacterium]